MKQDFFNPGRPGTHPDVVLKQGKVVRRFGGNAHAPRRTAGQAQRQATGMMLVECLLYIGLFFVVLAVAFKIFYSCWDNAKAIRRNTDQIAATLKLGERWRQDMRNATSTPQTINSADGFILSIPQKTGEIEYRFDKDALWRRTGATGEWTQVLAGVKASRMGTDRRQTVTAWRWELELTSKRKGTHVLPLFTFEAVPSFH